MRIGRYDISWWNKEDCRHYKAGIRIREKGLSRNKEGLTDNMDMDPLLLWRWSLGQYEAVVEQ